MAIPCICRNWLWWKRKSLLVSQIWGVERLLCLVCFCQGACWKWIGLSWCPLVLILVYKLYIYGEKVCTDRDSHGSNGVQKVICVLIKSWGVLWIGGRGGWDAVWAVVAVWYYGSTVRNFKGNCPCLWVFVDSGWEVEIVVGGCGWSGPTTSLCFAIMCLLS